jgi:hypothetical protein
MILTARLTVSNRPASLSDGQVEMGGTTETNHANGGRLAALGELRERLT